MGLDTWWIILLGSLLRCVLEYLYKQIEIIFRYESRTENSNDRYLDTEMIAWCYIYVKVVVRGNFDNLDVCCYFG